MVQRTVGRRDPRVPGARVRVQQARPARRPAVRADRPARPGVPLRRRRAADAEQARRLRLEEHQGQGAQGGQADRRRAGAALRGPAGRARSRVRRRTPRGSASWRTPSRSPRPPDQMAAIDEVKADMERARPDGPGDLRRRRLRQDRDRGAGGVQGGAGRQAGRRAGADDAAGPAAPATRSPSGCGRSRSTSGACPGSPTPRRPSR